MLWEDLIPAGCHWSGVIRRGVTLRLTDLEGGANCAALLYNFEEKTERYNMPDTLKAQHTAFLTAGNVCYSDMGRVLCSITADTAGWHDTICGLSNDATLRERYGVKRYQEHRNAMHRSASDGLLKEIGRWGLGRRDLRANLNFFSQGDGGRRRRPDLPARLQPGGCVRRSALRDARAGCPVGQHPPARSAPGLLAATGEAHRLAQRVRRPPTMLCRNHCPENERGFVNTERYFAQ